MRIYARLASVAMLAAASALAAPMGFHPPDPLGYTDGKACSVANGCNTRPTVASCLDCCDFHCPGPSLQLGCFDTCAPDEPKAIAALRVAVRAVEDGTWSTGDLAVIQAAQQSERPLVRRLAFGLANESKLRGLLVVPLTPRPAGADRAS